MVRVFSFELFFFFFSDCFLSLFFVYLNLYMEFYSNHFPDVFLILSFFSFLDFSLTVLFIYRPFFSYLLIYSNLSFPPFSLLSICIFSFQFLIYFGDGLKLLYLSQSFFSLITISLSIFILFFYFFRKYVSKGGQNGLWNQPKISFLTTIIKTQHRYSLNPLHQICLKTK